MRILLFFSTLFILSCSGQTKERQNIFRYNESKGIATLDPAYARNQTIIWPVNQLYNGLVQLDDSLRIQPCIAHSWNISDDGKTYTFFLRNDVFFHNHPVFKNGKGRRVIAQDFAYSLNRITAPEVASPGAWIFQHLDRNEQNNQTGFSTPGDSIFMIFLKDPFPAFLGILTMPYCFVVPKEVVEYYGDGFRNHPVGTGPFKFKIWREDEKLVLLRNENYFEIDRNQRSLPYLEAIAISFIKDKQSEFMEFMLGNIDFLSGVHAAYKDELITRAGRLNPHYANRFVMLTQPYLNTEYLGFLVDSSMQTIKGSPVLSKKVRQAINYGFDRVKMMKHLRNNIGQPALSGFIPDGMPSFDREEVTGYGYDPDKARNLLIGAGFPGGQGLLPIQLTTTSDYLDLCEYIQHELADLNIRIEIDVSTGAAFRNMVANSRLSFFRGSWIADYPDAENYLSLFYSKNFCPTGPNYTHYSNPEFDRLFEIAMTEFNDSSRYAVYRKLDQMIINEGVVVPLYYDQVVRFIPAELKGLGSNPMNLLTLKRTYWSTKS